MSPLSYLMFAVSMCHAAQMDAYQQMNAPEAHAELEQDFRDNEINYAGIYALRNHGGNYATLSSGNKLQFLRSIQRGVFSWIDQANRILHPIANCPFRPQLATKVLEQGDAFFAASDMTIYKELANRIGATLAYPDFDKSGMEFGEWVVDQEASLRKWLTAIHVSHVELEFEEKSLDFKEAYAKRKLADYATLSPQDKLNFLTTLKDSLFDWVDEVKLCQNTLPFNIKTAQRLVSQGEMLLADDMRPFRFLKERLGLATGEISIADLD